MNSDAISSDAISSDAIGSDAVTLAAQADLVLLTVEMLRHPNSLSETAEPWFEIPSVELGNLLDAALGSASQTVMDDSSELTPRRALADVQRCAATFETEDWADEYCRLFDGATVCPLNQASYIRRDKGKILGDVSGFYNAFGFRGMLDTGDRPDHLLCQLEYVAMLLTLASRAPDASSKSVVTDALSKFAQEHMHDWIPAVCWQMCEESQVEYFGAVSQWMLVLWQSLTNLHQWPIDELPDQRLKPIVDPDSPYECGAPDLHQIQTT